MNMTVINIILKTIIAYFLLLFLARVMGRKMISQMTFFDFVVGVTVGTITASVALGPSKSSTSAATALISIAVLTIITDFAHVKSFIFRKVVNSEPVVVIRNGKILEQNMKKVRFTVNELLAQLRHKKVFNIADVEFALVETDGKISVLLKSQKQPVTPSDLNISTSYKGLNKDIIIDGQVMKENLKDAGQDETWLTEQLENYNIEDIKQVFYAGLDTSGNLYVSKKHIQEEEPGGHGIE